jgi:hypothetical protein
MPRNILLMTATVTPLPGIPLLARTDPKLRLQDYQAALAFYVRLLGNCFDAIIFAENSNSDVSPLAAAITANSHVAKVEFVSFYGLDYPPAYGRGYGEFRLVDYAIENSKLLSADDIIWKVTGRYIVENIMSLVQSRPAAADLYCNMRNYPYRLCDLYLMAWTWRGYEAAIKGIYPKLRNDVIPNRLTIEEFSFRNLIDPLFGTINVVPRFKVAPLVHGVRGWNNTPYSRPWSFKIMARGFAHKFLPSLWI